MLDVEKLNASDKLGIALACLAGVMAIILFLVEKSPAAIVVLLALMLGLVSYPILHFLSGRNARILAALFSVLFAAGLGWREWSQTESSINDSDFYGTVTGWGAHAPGAGPGGEGYLEINNTKLVPFKDKYRLLVIARIHNTRVDALTDPIIQRSNAFAIESVGTAGKITVPFSQQFLSAALSLSGSRVEFEMSLCLIPRGLNPAGIATLSDVTAAGGHVFRPTYGGSAELGPAGKQPQIDLARPAPTR